MQAAEQVLPDLSPTQLIPQEPSSSSQADHMVESMILENSKVSTGVTGIADLPNESTEKVEKAGEPVLEPANGSRTKLTIEPMVVPMVVDNEVSPNIESGVDSDLGKESVSPNFTTNAAKDTSFSTIEKPGVINTDATNTDATNTDATNTDAAATTTDAGNCVAGHKKGTFSDISREDWAKSGIKLGKLYLVLFLMWLGILSIYWASLYGREKRVRNMTMLVVIEDKIFRLTNGTIVPPVIGPKFVELLNSNQDLGNYVVLWGQELAEKLLKNATVYLQIKEWVYQQDVWAAFYINSTALEVAYNLIADNNALQNATLELQYIVSCVYELGRLFSALSQYLIKNINRINLAWSQQYAPEAYAELFQEAFSSDEQMLIIQNTGANLRPSGLTYFPNINQIDLHLSTSSVVLGPSELGLVYALIFAFHQFNFAADMHTSLINRLHFADLLMYRFTFSQFNFFVLSLVYSLITIAFGVPIDAAYGKGGFMVLWMTVYMFFSATGGTMEVMATFLRYMGLTFVLPLIMVFLIVVNIAPTFSALVLCPGVFRYGNALPMFNTSQALKVVFFGTWRGTLGRNYGVLAAWIVLNTCSMIGLLYYIRKHPRADKPLI